MTANDAVNAPDGQHRGSSINHRNKKPCTTASGLDKVMHAILDLPVTTLNTDRPELDRLRQEQQCRRDVCRLAAVKD